MQPEGDLPVNPDPLVLASVRSVRGHIIRLTYRQWVHITESHDYMIGNRDKVLETVADPDRLVAGDHGATIALRHYATTTVAEKTCVTIYRDEENGFTITAFLTSRPDKIVRKGETLWQRPLST